MSFTIAGIDIHKRVLMVVVADASEPELEFEGRRFGTGAAELAHLAAWLAERGVQEVVMESTAQYWKPVWLELEAHFRLHLAQAQSNRAPKGRKWDFGDARRLLRRFVAGELYLSYVPDAEQRSWRTVTRGKLQLVQERVRLHNQVESLLEEGRIKLSSVISDVFGLSGRRILRALAAGQTDPEELAKLGDDRLRCGRAALVDALSGSMQPVHRRLLGQHLDRLELVDQQIQELNRLAAELMKAHQAAILRLAEIPGLGLDSAQQIVAEVGATAEAFPSAAKLASWVGVCPGRHESAQQNHSSRCAKGNHYLRRILCQAAQAAVKTKGSYLQGLFRRLLVRLGYQKAIWAIAHRLCRLTWVVLHRGVTFIEHGSQPPARARKRHKDKLLRALRNLGYDVHLTPRAPAASPA